MRVTAVLSKATSTPDIGRFVAQRFRSRNTNPNRQMQRPTIIKLENVFASTLSVPHVVVAV